MADIATYIGDMRAKGYSDPQISQQLRQAGWTDDQISKVFADNPATPLAQQLKP